MLKNVDNQLTHKQLVGMNSSHIHWYTPKMGVHQKMYHAFEKMQAAAKQDQIDLQIASGFRSFERQLQLWNNKFTAKTPIKNIAGKTVEINNLTEQEKIHAILTYSALPGASRHHWGTDIDVYAPNLLPNNAQLQLEPWEYEPTGPMGLLSHWLEKNCHNFDFYFPYDRYRGGIAHEPWHMSYAPLADNFEQQLTVEILIKVLHSSEVAGKSAIIENIDGIYHNFINNINKR